MKRSMFVRGFFSLLGVAALLPSLSFAQTQSERPQPTPTGCHSKGVEVHSFYGTTDDVLRGMDKLTTNRSGSRMYALILEASKSAEIRVYEQTAAKDFTVSTWRGADVGDLRATLDRIMLKTRGSACAGAEIKRVLAQRGFTLRNQTAAMPASSRAAFAPVVESYRGYLRVTVLDPCETQTTPTSVAYNQ
jgi:hypothetical protein